MQSDIIGVKIKEKLWIPYMLIGVSCNASMVNKKAVGAIIEGAY